MEALPKELRRRARAALDGKYILAVNLTASYMLATFALNMLLQSSGLSASGKISQQVMYWALYLIVLLLNALFEAGLVRFLYLICQGDQKFGPGLLLYCFRHQPDTYILTFAFRYAVSLVWFLPALLVYLKLPAVIDLADIPQDLPSLLLQMFAFALLGLIPAVLLSLPWCLTTYVLLDEPLLSAPDALRESRRLMHGSYGRTLRLWIGFLPLFLLGFTSLGLGFLWVRPYFHTTMAQVYLELKEKAA